MKTMPIVVMITAKERVFSPLYSAKITLSHRTQLVRAVTWLARVG